VSLRKYPGISIPDIPNKKLRDRFQTLDIFLKDIEAAVATLETQINLPTPAGAAPRDAEYVVVNLDATLPNERRLVGTAPITITDNGAGVSVAVGITLSALGGTPAIVFAATPVAGIATTFIRTDDTLEFPQALQSVANNTTLTLTDDGVRMQLTSSLDDLQIIPAGGSTGDIRLLSKTDFTQRVGIGNPPSGTTMLTVVGLQPVGGSSCKGLDFQVTSRSATNNSTSFGITGFITTSSAVGEGEQNLVGGSAEARIAGVNKTVKSLTGFQSQQGFVVADGTSVVTDAWHFRGLAPQEIAPVADPVITNAYGVDIAVWPTWAVNAWGIRTQDRAEFNNPSFRTNDVLTLNQLAVTAGDDGAHIFFNSKTTNPTIENDGQLWYNGTELFFKPSGTRVNLLASGGGGGQATHTKAFVAAGDTLVVPDRNQIVVCNEYEIEATGELELAAGAILHILEAAA